jgi:FAD/FMN-containing dehydrogenase
VFAFFEDTEAGRAAIDTIVSSGLQVAALEFLDAGSLAAGAATFPALLPEAARFLVISEADGTVDAADALHREVVAEFVDTAVSLVAPTGRREITDLWRWRHSVSSAVTEVHGGKVSEDVVVPTERLADAIRETVAIAGRHGLERCSWDTRRGRQPSRDLPVGAAGRQAKRAVLGHPHEAVGQTPTRRRSPRPGGGFATRLARCMSGSAGRRLEISMPHTPRPR